MQPHKFDVSFRMFQNRTLQYSLGYQQASVV
jgi:hypothetical protein